MATANTLGTYEIKSRAGAVTLHVDADGEDCWVEADDDHHTSEIMEIMREVDRLGFEVIWGDEELATLTDTGVRRYCRMTTKDVSA